KVLAPDRLNSLVFGVFAGVALLIAVVGVAGGLGVSVGGGAREVGIRLARGAPPGNSPRTGGTEGGGQAGAGGGDGGAGAVAAGAIGFAAARRASSYFADLKMPGSLAVVLSALVLLTAAVVASMMPAMRAARVDVIQALRSE